MAKYPASHNTLWDSIQDYAYKHGILWHQVFHNYDLGCWVLWHTPT